MKKFAAGLLLIGLLSLLDTTHQRGIEIDDAERFFVEHIGRIDAMIREADVIAENARHKQQYGW